jgi:hypothetical protein
MPSWFPEGNTPKPGDDAWRSLVKWCDLLYEAYGDRGPAYFPEGSKPLPSDSVERLAQKINALYIGAGSYVPPESQAVKDEFFQDVLDESGASVLTP